MLHSPAKVATNCNSSSSGRSGAIKVQQGPQGNRRYQVSLPNGRQVSIYTDRELTPDQLQKAVGWTASAFPALGAADFEWMRHSLDGVNEVFLYPNLGVESAGSDRPKHGTSRRSGDSISLGVDSLATADEAALALSGPGAQADWLPYRSEGRRSSERTAIDDPRLDQRWPGNTTVIAGARQGEMLPTYGTWLERGLERLPEARSLPEALGELNGRELVDRDDDGLYKVTHPVTSTNFGKGWVKSENRPRIALIFSGALGQAGQPNYDNAQVQMQNLRQSLLQNYPGVQIIQINSATAADVEQGMREMAAFASQNPGAESLVFSVAHGHTDPARPGSQPDLANGGLEGQLGMEGPEGSRQLSEKRLKQMAERYLSNFDNNLMMFYTCHSGAFVA